MEYVRGLVEAIQKRIGVDVFSEKKILESFAAVTASTTVTEQQIRVAVRDVLEHLKVSHGIVGAVALVGDGFIEPPELANFLVRVAAIPYRPEFPRPSEWKTEASLGASIRCSIIIVMQTLLPETIRRVAVAEKAPPTERPKEPPTELPEVVKTMIADLAVQSTVARAACYLMRPELYALVYHAMMKLPDAERPGFMERLFLVIGTEGKEPSRERLEELILLLPSSSKNLN